MSPNLIFFSRTHFLKPGVTWPEAIPWPAAAIDGLLAQGRGDTVIKLFAN